MKPEEEGRVLRLFKGLYRLKQAGGGWYMEMTRVFIKELGFERSAIDHLVYYRHKGEEHMIVAVATDDMALTSKRAEDAQQFKAKIKIFWDITDHGPIKWFLRFEIKRDQDARTLAINQRAYIKGMVEWPRQSRYRRPWNWEYSSQWINAHHLSTKWPGCMECPISKQLGVYCGP